MSLSKVKEEPGTIRHLGFENDKTNKFQSESDPDGVLWEFFNEELQKEEDTSDLA